MVVVRFKVQCQPDKTDTVRAAMLRVVHASRSMAGVVSFDIGTDISDPNTLIATEVFEDLDARTRQESLAEVAETMALMPTALAAPPDVLVLDATSAEPASAP